MKRKKVFKFMLYAVLVLSTSKVFAAYTCTGKIDVINQAYEGSVSIVSSGLYGDSSGRTVCNLVSSWKGVSVEVCKGWLSKLLSHEARNKELTIQYNDTLSSCTSQLTWASASNPWAMW